MNSIIHSIATCLLLSICVSINAQNVGVGTATPMAKMDVSGDLALREGTALTLVNGANNNIAATANSFYRIVSPTAAFSITGLTGGQNGKVLVIYNTTAFAMTISNENAGSAITNRIRTMTGADIVTPITNGATVTLMYNSTQALWLVLSATTSPSASSGWGLLGNAGTLPATNFVGTTDAQDLVFRTENTQWMRLNRPFGQLMIYGTLPGAVGNGKLTISGVSSSWDIGPHIDFKYDGDINSGMHIQNYAHDNSTISFDAYHTGPGNWISSHAGSNFQIKKNLNLLRFNYNTGSAPGATIAAWNTGMVMTTAGFVGIGNAAPTSRLHVTGGVRIEDGTQGAGKIFTSDATGNGTWRYPAIATKSIFLASGVANSNPLVTASWALIYDTGTNDQLRIENPAASITNIKYSYSINNGVPVAASLTPGAFVVITGFVCSSDLRIQVSRYSTAGDQNHINFTGMGMCNGWIRGTVFYDL